VDQPGKFVFLTPAEYAKLDFAQRDRYLRRAQRELDRRLALHVRPPPEGCPAKALLGDPGERPAGP
jgi:hypothetical protein